MKPTYEQLEAKLERTEGLLKLALERISKLEEQLNKNSKNSSKPPSTDQKADSSAKQPKKRKSRKGYSRAPYPPERVDHRISCKRTSCPHCSSHRLEELSDAPFSWQQAELPVVQAIVTQYDCLKYECKQCNRRSMGSLPENIPFSAFGPKLMALITCLTGRFHLAKREVSTLIKDLYDIDLSEGSIINVEENVSNALEVIYGKIHRYVIEGKRPRYFDETTWRNGGKRRYIWIGTTKSAAYYRIDPHRSRKALLKLVGNFTNRPAVTDRYGAYRVLDGPRQYCLAHLIRDFHAYSQREGEDAKIGSQIEEELRKICRKHREWREEEITKPQYGAYLRHSKHRLGEYLIDGLALGSDELSGLCERLSDEFERLWTFKSIEGMEPTNNMAERDLRKLVLWRKKSYGTRSERGEKFVERITSVIETLKKNKHSPLKYLEDAIQAFYAKQPPPSIAPALGI